jgi:uncharacterized protein (TIGR03083 family)
MNVPIVTLPLFPELDKRLLELLRSLAPADWNKPTLARLWTVKDVAAHLLDGNIRTISMLRDQHFGDPPGSVQTYVELVDYLNRLNADWVKALRRMSPPVLIELLEITGKEYTHLLSQLDPFSPAIFAVSWAGHRESPNWFHIAREYTEKWHHQQQIREAVGKPGIMTRELFFPLIDTFMQALPHNYRHIKAEKNTAVNITVNSGIGGEWLLLYQDDGWKLKKARVGNIKTEIMMDPSTAWKLFTKAITGEEARKQTRIQGDQALGEPILSMLAVMA